MDELQIVYTTEAMQDILGISDYYFDKVGESAALRAVDALQNHIDKLMRFPPHGRRTSRRIFESIELLQAGPRQSYCDLPC